MANIDDIKICSVSRYLQINGIRNLEFIAHFIDAPNGKIGNNIIIAYSSIVAGVISEKISAIPCIMYAITRKIIRHMLKIKRKA